MSFDVAKLVGGVVGLLFPLWLPITATAQARAGRLPTKIYTTESGLAHNRVKRIVRDSRGFIWFCTADGLSRFDGHRFTNYGAGEGLPAPSINDLLETGDGVYWIATNSDGVVRFDPLAGLRPAASGAPPQRFTPYLVSGDPVTNRVNVLYSDRAGTLWAGTDGGLFYMDGVGEFRRVELGIPSHPDIQVQVWALAEDRGGSLWVGTKFGLVRRSPDGRMLRYAVRPSEGADNISALLIDGEGRLWVGHHTGLITFDPEWAHPPEHGHTGQSAMPAGARRYTTADGLDNDAVLALCQASDGRIWVRTFGSGLTEFDGDVFRTYLVAQRSGDNTGSLTEDGGGNLWLGTKASGALKVTRHGFTVYGEYDGLGQSVGSVFQGRAGGLYVTSSVWLVSRLEGGRFTTVRPNLPRTVTDGSWRDVSGVIEDRSGRWWVATREGLYRFPRVSRFEELARARPESVYTTRDGLANDDVTKLFEDSRGDIWVASWVPAREALTRWERVTSRFRRYSEADGLRPFTSALAFGEDAAGGVWVGFREGGLARYRDGRFTLLGPGDGLPAGAVHSIYPDQAGRLWVAVMRGGLCRIDDPQVDRPHVIRYTTAEGLASDAVNYVTGDSAGRVYVGSSRGIDRLDPGTGRVKHYSTADGLTGAEFKAAFRDRGGALWFGTTAGLSRLNPEPESATTPPVILIGGLRVAGTPRPLSALGEPAVSGLELEAAQGNIQIDYFGVSPGAGETLRYQYKLEGTEGDWSAPTEQRSVNYASLAPGAYRFLVRAVGADGPSPAPPAAVTFKILPPVWLRWWFLALAASLVAAAGFVSTRSRSRRLTERRRSEDALRKAREERLAELELVRKRIATDLHDDIGSSLTRISLLSEVVRRRAGVAAAPLAEPLSSIASLSRELVDSMSDIVWSINPDKDHLRDLSQRMRRFASDVFTARQIDFRFRAPAAEHDIKVGANVRRELFLVFKEAVNNAVRHSGCAAAEIEFRAGAEELFLKLSDDGRGFDTARSSAGHGLASMRERTEALGGRLDVLSRPGQGTTLTFTIPLADRPPAPSAAAGKVRSTPA